MNKFLRTGLGLFLVGVVAVLLMLASTAQAGYDNQQVAEARGRHGCVDGMLYYGEGMGGMWHHSNGQSPLGFNQMQQGNADRMQQGGFGERARLHVGDYSGDPESCPNWQDRNNP
ncbi:MAG: hypothetical protein WD740_00150 [Anaerolineales bacterium]